MTLPHKGSNFFILALITLTAGNTYHARNIVASVFVMVWATRLAGNSPKQSIRCYCTSYFIYQSTGFLLFRVLKRGSDSRFDDIRSHFFKFLGEQYRLTSLLIYLYFSGFWIGKLRDIFLDLILYLNLEHRSDCLGK